MNIDGVIEKLKCATRCHPMAVETLICEAIEMLIAEREQWMKQEPVAHRARDIQGNWVYRDGPFRYAPFEKLYKHPLPASSCA